jgi:uncharacterized damage-inducible protein DinB
MFRRVDDFRKAWAHESESTLKVLQALTDGALSQAVSRGHRTLGRVAWHLAATPREMLERVGLGVSGPSPDERPPSSAEAIARAYAEAARSVAEGLASWTDATLEVEDDMYGERWPRGLTLQALLTHQAHHRGQMTVLMRQAGLAVPGVYGPAREEWTAYGMEPPVV